VVENSLITETAKFVGFPIILFIIWLYYHRSTMLIFTKIVDNQYGVLKELIETNHCTISSLARIEQKIDDNAWCPFTRERMKEGKKKDE
jgi:Fe2+ transport system protein B